MERLKALEIFKAVVDHGSFTRAADAANVAVPSVSRAVQDLETMLGVQLFHRTTRKVTLTTAGHAVLEHATGVLDCFDDLARVGNDAALDIAGDLRIEVPALYGMARLAPVLGGFLREHPKLRLDIRLVDHQAQTLGDLADLAIVTGRAVPASCVARPLAATRLGVYASAAFLAAHGTPQHPRDVQAGHCMAVATGQQQMTWTLHHAHSGACATLGVRSPWRTNCPGALMAAALEGAGVAIAPEHLAQPHVARGDLVRLLDDWHATPLDTYLLYRTRRNQPLRVRKLIERIVETLGEARDRDASTDARLALRAA